jgi:hypothetical protein
VQRDRGNAPQPKEDVTGGKPKQQKDERRPTNYYKHLPRPKKDGMQHTKLAYKAFSQTARLTLPDKSQKQGYVPPQKKHKPAEDLTADHR